MCRFQNTRYLGSFLKSLSTRDNFYAKNLAKTTLKSWYYGHIKTGCTFTWPFPNSNDGMNKSAVKARTWLIDHITPESDAITNPLPFLPFTVQTMPHVYLVAATLRWRHNERDSVSNHQPCNCLLKAPRHWPFWGNSPVTGEFPAQMASYVENISIWWRHHLWETHLLQYISSFVYTFLLYHVIS